METKIAERLQSLANASAEGLHDKVVQQTLASTEKLYSSIEASSNINLNEHSKLQQNMVQMIKDMAADCGKNNEACIGVFGNSVRAHLDNMQASQQTQRADSEKHIFARMDQLANKMQHESQKQASEMRNIFEKDVFHKLDQANMEQNGGFKELSDIKSFMENFEKVQNNRHQDMSSAISSVLEQACGAKSRAEECMNKMHDFHNRLRTERQFTASPSFKNEMGMEEEEPYGARLSNRSGPAVLGSDGRELPLIGRDFKQQRSSGSDSRASADAMNRPSTANSTNRSRQELTKQASYGMQVLNS
jgi:hypothetical protein